MNSTRQQSRSTRRWLVLLIGLLMVAPASAKFATLHPLTLDNASGPVWHHDPSAHHFVGCDGGGNVAMLVNATNGIQSARYEYGPFGEPIRATGDAAGSNVIRYSTKFQDDESGLLYFGYRFYSAETGRWLSRNPMGEAGGLNEYGFVGNDPVNGVDYLGLWNLWNPGSWGVGNGAGWSMADSLNPFHESASWDGYSWDYFGNSAQATLDGIIPFTDPFLEGGGYDGCDEWLSLSRDLGRLARDAYLLRLQLGLAQWGMAGSSGLHKAALLPAIWRILQPVSPF